MNQRRRGDICLPSGRHRRWISWFWLHPTELRLDAHCEGGMARVHPTRRAAGHGAPIDATNTSVLLSWANHTDVEDAQYDENEPTRQIPAAWTFPPGKREYCDGCRLGLAISHEDPHSMMLITASAGSFHDQGVLLNGNGNRPGTACSGRRLYTTREATVHNLIWCAPEKSASIETVEFHITASGGASMPFKRYIFVLSARRSMFRLRAFASKQLLQLFDTFLRNAGLVGDYRGVSVGSFNACTTLTIFGVGRGSFGPRD